MLVENLAEKFKAVIMCEKTRGISTVYCCDLASNALGKMKSGSLWITVIASENTIAVAVAADAGAVLFAEGNMPSAELIAEAERHGVNLFVTDLPVYEAALMVKSDFSAV